MDTIEVRHPDGSFDFDFHRARANALRSQALLDAFRSKLMLKFCLATIAGLMGFVLAVASQPARAVGGRRSCASDV
jgi:hypothetical protein